MPFGARTKPFVGLLSKILRRPKTEYDKLVQSPTEMQKTMRHKTVYQKLKRGRPTKTKQLGTIKQPHYVRLPLPRSRPFIMHGHPTHQRISIKNK